MKAHGAVEEKKDPGTTNYEEVRNIFLKNTG